MIDMLVTAGLTLGVAFLAYLLGVNKHKLKVKEETSNALDKALEARNSVRTHDDAKRVLMEHARDVQSVRDPKTDS